MADLLRITVLDVGWGDSILVESLPDGGPARYGLIDCNDTSRQRSALAFVKRYFERRGHDWKATSHNFEWVLLTHGHADHGRGLKQMMKTFGTRHFWYPKSVASTTFASLLSYASRSSKVQHHQAVDETKQLVAPQVDFGADLEVLWPDWNVIDSSNENNNSVVLALTLDGKTVVLTGDVESGSWGTIVGRLPASTVAFQAPHHGAHNGMFHGGARSWLDHFVAQGQSPAVVMSSHTVPHGHPDPQVVTEISQEGLEVRRTDEDYHVTVELEEGVAAPRILYTR